MFAMRGRALECLGHVAVAIGPEHFGRYFVTGAYLYILNLQDPLRGSPSWADIYPHISN